MELNEEAAKKEKLLIIMRTMRQIFFAEILGTALFMYIGCCGNMIGLGSLTFGFAVTAATQIVGHISGAHINPSVSIAAVIVGEIKLIYLPVYIIAQIIGAFLGYTLIFSSIMIDVKNPSLVKLGVTFIRDINVVQALSVETITTLILVITYCAFWHTRHSTSTLGAVVLGIGLQGVYIGFRRFTGASMNCARSLAPAVINNVWKHHWIYWVGPNIGAVLGAGFYRYLLMYGPLTYPT